MTGSKTPSFYHAHMPSLSQLSPVFCPSIESVEKQVEGVEKRTMIAHHLSKSIINSINYYYYLFYINT